jgi:predicted outer membrane repeat protein
VPLRPTLRRRALATSAVLALAAAGVVLYPTAASAAPPIMVTSVLDDGTPGTLRAAITAADAAPGADVIGFALPTGSVIQLLSTITAVGGLTIDGSAVPDLTITGTGGLGTYLLLNFAPDTADQAFAVNDVIFDGQAGTTPGWLGVAINTGSGALSNKVAALSLTRVIVQDVTGPLEGSAVRVFNMQAGGPVTITDSDFLRNTSTVGSLEGGGAVYLRGMDGLVSIVGSAFRDNTARSGGAVFLNGQGGGVADLAVSSSVFTGNTANGTGVPAAVDGNGGAIAANILGDLAVADSVFASNTAGVDGGAIAVSQFNPASTVSIARSSFVDNGARFQGGGFWTSTPDGTLSVDSSTFAGNTLSYAQGDAPLGNSIAVVGSGTADLTVTSSTFDELAGPYSSWAIWMTNHTLGFLSVSHSTVVGPGAIGIGTLGNSLGSIDHSILWSLGGPLDAVAIFSPGLPGSNTIDTNWTLSSGGQESYLAGGTGNHFNVAAFGLGALANNGGPTATRLPADTSAAHNSGNPAIAAPPVTDQRGAGFARVVQTIDIGAVEVQPAVAAPPAAPAAALPATGLPIAPWMPLGGFVLLALGAVMMVRYRVQRTR